jgi:hypothetical protein
MRGVAAVPQKAAATAGRVDSEMGQEPPLALQKRLD